MKPIRLLILVMLLMSRIVSFAGDSLTFRTWKDMTNEEILEEYSVFKRSAVFCVQAQIDDLIYAGSFTGFSYSSESWLDGIGAPSSYETKYMHGTFHFRWEDPDYRSYWNINGIRDTTIYDPEGLKKAQKVVYEDWKKQFKNLKLDGYVSGVDVFGKNGKIEIKEIITITKKNGKTIKYPNYYDGDEGYEFWQNQNVNDLIILKDFVEMNGGNLADLPNGADLSVNRLKITVSKDIKSISFPDNIVDGFPSLEDCVSLDKVSFSSQAVDMPNLTGCKSLRYVNSSSLGVFNLPSTLVKISSFAGCESLKKIIIPDNVKNIYYSDDGRENYNYISFKGCISLESVALGRGITEIPNYCFEDCINLKIIIPDSHVENYATLKYVIIPSQITKIGERAFNGCKSLTRVDVEEQSHLEIIGSYAFIDCSSLLSVVLPKSLKSLEYGAFMDCYNLEDIYAYMTNPFKISEYTFWCYTDKRNDHIKNYVVYNSATLHVPDDTNHLYSNTEYWNLFTHIFGINDPGGKQGRYEEVDGLKYFLNYSSKTAKVVADDYSEMRSVTIPDVITFTEGDYRVTAIDSKAFYKCQNLSFLDIGSNLETIGSSAFEETGISGAAGNGPLVFPEGLKTIGDRAFYFCPKIHEMVLPSTLERVGDNAFIQLDNLKKVVSKMKKPIEIPDNAFSFENFPYFNQAIPTLYVPKGSKSLYEAMSCWNKFEIVEDESDDSGSGSGLPEGTTFEESGIAYVVMANNNVSITNGRQASGNFAIPSTVVHEGNSFQVTSVGDNAFTNCTALTSLTIPASVTSIGEAALAGCTSLTAFTVADGNNSFTVDDGILYNIDKTTLVCCPGGKTGNVTVPATVTKIEPNGFYNCINLTGVRLQAGVKNIGDAAFVGCSNLTTMDFPSGSQSKNLLFGRGCFTGCTSLASFTVDGKKDGRIGGDGGNYGIFDGVLYVIWGTGEVSGLLAYPCKHGDVYTVSEGATYISDYAFCMTDIKEVTLPSSLRGLNGYAFGYCNNLTKVIVKALIPCEAADAFAGTAEHATLYVLSDGLKGLYQTSDGWNGFSGYVGGNEQITIFADNAREQFFKVLDGSSVALVAIAARNGSKITIPAQVTSGANTYTVTTLGIGLEKNSILGVDGVLRHFDYSLFDLCNSYMYDQVKEVVIPNTVTKIGNSAFNGNFGRSGSVRLTSVEIPGSVEEIGGWAFAYNETLTTLILNNGLKKIGEGAFVDAGIKSVTIPETVTRIESQAFNSCLSLESATIPPSVQFIGNFAFQTAEGFNTLKVNISDLEAWCKVDSDGEYWEGPVWMCPLFLNGNEVTELVIPDGMTSISKVFLSCPSLTKVTIPSSIQDIGCAFSFCANLQTVINLSEEPQIIETYTTNGVEARTRSEGETHAAFDYTDKNACVLYVPKGCVEKYRAAIGWKDFVNIVEMSSSAIDGILMDGKPFDVYDLQGRRVLSGAISLKSLPKGMYIVRGRKVVVK